MSKDIPHFSLGAGKLGKFVACIQKHFYAIFQFMVSFSSNFPGRCSIDCSISFYRNHIVRSRSATCITPPSQLNIYNCKFQQADMRSGWLRTRSHLTRINNFSNKHKMEILTLCMKGCLSAIKPQDGWRG